MACRSFDQYRVVNYRARHYTGVFSREVSSRRISAAVLCIGQFWIILIPEITQGPFVKFRPLEYSRIRRRAECLERVESGRAAVHLTISPKPNSRSFAGGDRPHMTYAPSARGGLQTSGSGERRTCASVRNRHSGKISRRTDSGNHCGVSSPFLVASHSFASGQACPRGRSRAVTDRNSKACLSKATTSAAGSRRSRSVACCAVSRLPSRQFIIG